MSSTKTFPLEQHKGRGSLGRVEILEAPLIAKLTEIQRRKEEDLQQIEDQKRAAMESFQKQMESEFGHLQNVPSKRHLAKRKTDLVDLLLSKKVQYEKEKAQLKRDCKGLKKANKKLVIENGKLQYAIASLEENQVTRQEKADAYLKSISVVQERIREKIRTVDKRVTNENQQKTSLKECIAGIFVRVEPRSDMLVQKLSSILEQNKVFLF